jgi:hypothetical protein
MFKQRLKKTGKVGGIIILCVIGAGVFAYLSSLLANWMSTVQTGEGFKHVIGYIALFLLACWLGFCVFKAIQGIVWFIKWLFVEPYKARRRGKGV